MAIELVTTIEILSGVLATVAGLGTLMVIVARLAGIDRITALAVRSRRELTIAVAGYSMLASLYFSEIAKFTPCRLCWYQRIFMYPVAIIALVSLIRRDHAYRVPAVVLASIGALVSLYHSLIEWGVLEDSEECLIGGPPCAAIWFRTFGIYTLAVMALIGFVTIIVLNTIGHREDS